MWSIPNIITMFRIILIPIFVMVFYAPIEESHFWAAFVFWVASISDMLDGYLARRLDQSTAFGAFLDPVADKLMVAAACFLIVEDYQTIWITLPAITMIGREILVSALREWMAELGKRANVAVSTIGKYKTAAQMLALIGLIWRPEQWQYWGIPWYLLSYVAWILLYVAFALTLWSMLTYLKAAWSDLTTDHS